MKRWSKLLKEADKLKIHVLGAAQHPMYKGDEKFIRSIPMTAYEGNAEGPAFENVLQMMEGMAKVLTIAGDKNVSRLGKIYLNLTQYLMNQGTNPWTNEVVIVGPQGMDFEVIGFPIERKEPGMLGLLNRLEKRFASDSLGNAEDTALRIAERIVERAKLKKRAAENTTTKAPPSSETNGQQAEGQTEEKREPVLQT
jgi:hypothetical protein